MTQIKSRHGSHPCKESHKCGCLENLAGPKISPEEKFKLIYLLWARTKLRIHHLRISCVSTVKPKVTKIYRQSNSGSCPLQNRQTKPCFPVVIASVKHISSSIAVKQSLCCSRVENSPSHWLRDLSQVSRFPGG